MAGEPPPRPSMAAFISREGARRSTLRLPIIYLYSPSAPVNAAQICALFDGGGHACAAGCTLPGPKEAATERIVAAIGAYLEQQKEDGR